MIESTLQLPEKTGSRDEDIARLCRQVCLCRTRGQTAEADRLEAALRDQVPPEFSDEALREIFSNEQRRVIDALVLAEFLGPLLVEHFATSAAGKRTSPAPSAVSPPRPAASRDPLDIADLIEGMLQQERTTRIAFA